MKKITSYNKLCVTSEAILRDAMQRLNESEYSFLVVLNNGELLGTITDGDIRRAILKGFDLNSSVTNCMNNKPIISNLKENKKHIDIFNAIRGITKFLPVIGSNNKLKYILVNNSKKINKTALIMAGGFGKRLGMKTHNTPKPLLKIGAVPLLETLLIKLEKANYANIYVSVFYLHAKIVNFIKKRKSKAKIKILIEEKPLGTAGCINIISHEDFSTLTVINGDIVSDINLEALTSFHSEKNNDITISVAKYINEIPFGTVELDKNFDYQSIKVKPKTNNFVLSGIYCLNNNICKLVDGKYLDMPSLITNANKLGNKIGVFPIYEYWKDIGTPKDFILEVNRSKKKQI